MRCVRYTFCVLWFVCYVGYAVCDVCVVSGLDVRCACVCVVCLVCVVCALRVSRVLTV